MENVLKNKKVILVAGSGGVGKTTLSAAIAVGLSEMGHHTVVLTVDPAKRLAQALGIESWAQDCVCVPIGGLGSLHANQLRSSRYLDELVHRITKDPIQRSRILQNPLYQAISTTLAGTHEYAAMERILEFVDDPRFSRLVVDTPPTDNAVDLLTAPKRMIEFMEIARVFAGRQSFFSSLFHRSAALVLKALKRVLGIEFYEAFERLMKDIDGLQQGFRDRNRRILELLRSNECAFVLATVPSLDRLEEAREFQTIMHEQGIALRSIILNQLEEAPPEIGPRAFEADPSLKEWHHSLALVHTQEQAIVARFDSFHIPTIQIRRFDDAPSTLADLSRLGASLLS